MDRFSAAVARLLSVRIISNGIWALSGKVIIAISSLAINALLARLLSPAEMGIYFLLMTLVAALAMAAQLGLNHVVVRMIAEALGKNDPSAAKSAVRAVALYGFIGAALAAASVGGLPGQWLATEVFDSQLMRGALGAAAMLVFFAGLQSLLGEALRGFHDVPRATIVGGLLSSLSFVLALAIIFALGTRLSLTAVLWVNVVGFAVAVLAGGFWLMRKLVHVKPHNSPTGRRVLSLAAPMFLVNIFVFLLMQADLWLVGMYRPPAEVAVYGAAARLAATTMLITSLLYAVLPPYIAEKFARQEIGALQELLRSAATATTLLALPWVAMLVIFAPQLLSLVYGPYYASGHSVLVLLSLGLLSNVLTGMRGYVLLMTGHERALLVLTAISSAFHIALCWLAAKYLNSNWVALAAMLATIVHCTAEMLLVKRRLGIWTFFSFRAVETIQAYLLRQMQEKRTRIGKNH